MSDRIAVRVRSLEKRYGRDVALAGIDLTVPEGSVVLLVGPNGAGKSTLLKVLLDLLPADGGEVEVLGRSPATDGARVRAGIGFLPEKVDFPFDGMKVREVLALHARFRPTWDDDYAAELARALDLRLDRAWKKLSKGESRRAQVVTVLAHRPPLLLLDEPTDGLDPLIRERVLSLLAEHLAETAATAIYCTHVLHEAQTMADRLFVLRAGTVRVDDSVEALRRTHSRVRIRTGSDRTNPLVRPDFLVRVEGRTGGEERWIVRTDERALRDWAARNDLEVSAIDPVSLADTALAYLTDGEDR